MNKRKSTQKPGWFYCNLARHHNLIKQVCSGASEASPTAGAC